ncbi:MAG: ABC transporter permease subunit [Anaerolineae bacterium]|nr:ABC transporter permease subunit [Candidatus Roseilinea sp.]MDW8449247.1 ABC transporter permease subunit [Anaerolineae bacterium]
MTRLTFPTREALRRLPFTPADVAIIIGALALIVVVAYVGSTALVPFQPPDVLPEPISLDVIHLPYYLARSTLRMFIALFFSVLFTFTYGYVAAHSPRAERVLIPLLDILQSVPVLGFLSVTITFFIALFRGSLLGLEAASIFAIFTSQVWNMTFSFYHSLRTIPREQQEMARMFRLSRWQYFTKVEVPNSMIGLTWNTMMSFGGGWFFVAASEAISVLNQDYRLPGIGAYVTEAIDQQNFGALIAAIVAMAIMIILVDQLVWRPLIAWSQKFRNEQSEAHETPTSWVLNLWRAARLPSLISEALRPASEFVNRALSGTLAPKSAPMTQPRAAMPRWVDWVYNGLIVALVIGGAVVLIRFILGEVGLPEVGNTFVLGLITMLRVAVLTTVSTLIWAPVGVAIGFNPRLARLIQPVAQFLSAFPANFLFPFVTVALIATGISLNVGSILLMSLGAQWYILFNVIAGAQTIPSDLREMAANMGLRGWKLWRRLIIPGIFSAWVTGGITASGGAWNASIVAEVVSWGDTTLTATGLGAYIANATEVGDWPRIALGVGMMALFVVVLNRLFWRRLYALAESKYVL